MLHQNMIHVCGWQLRPFQTWITIDDRVSFQRGGIRNVMPEDSPWMALVLNDEDKDALNSAQLETTWGKYLVDMSLYRSANIIHDIIGCERHIKLDCSWYSIVGTGDICKESWCTTTDLFVERSADQQYWVIIQAVSPALDNDYYRAAAVLEGERFLTRKDALNALASLVQPPA